MKMSGPSSGDDSMEIVEKAATPSPAALGKEAISTEWTDEKHSLYLKSMEASFVDELYSSADLHGWQKGHGSALFRSSKDMNSRMTTQFKVHQNGSWKKLGFLKGERVAQGLDEHRLLLSNPWVRHFRPGHKHDEPFMTNQDSFTLRSQPWICGVKELGSGLSDTSKQFSLCSCHQDSVHSNEEASDQNFIDGSDDEDEADHDVHRMKRLKTSESSTSRIDKVHN